MQIFVVAVPATYIHYYPTLPTCRKKFPENFDQYQDEDNIANLENSRLPMAAISKEFCLYFSVATHPISIKYDGQMSKPYSKDGHVDKIQDGRKRPY